MKKIIAEKVCEAVSLDFKRRKITHEKAAKAIGKSKAVVDNQISGKKPFSKAMAELFAKAFGYNTQFLLYGEGELRSAPALSLNKLKIYISGKISGHEARARKQFAEAQQRLTAAGYDTVNPFDNGLKDDDPWEKHLAVDIIDLLACDGICQLPGWEDSRGARLEAEVARTKGIPFISFR